MNLALIIFVILLSFYHLVCEYAFNGRSLGKYTMRLQVVKLNGKKLTFWDCMLRWIFRLIDISISSGVVALVPSVLNALAICQPAQPSSATREASPSNK